MKRAVEPHVFAKFDVQARSLLGAMAAGDTPDLTLVSNGLGSDVETLLCDLFRLDEATSKYWVDGVTIDTATVRRNRGLVLTARVWCADHHDQWQVPSEIGCRFSDGVEPTLESLTIRLGNAALRTLAAHRDRSIVKTANPAEWLLTFEIGSHRPTGELP